MEYEYLVGLKKHPSWRLLSADSAPLIIGFFYRVFTRENRRTIAADEMTAKLEDFLKVVELGFLRRFSKDAQAFEVRRILKALVDADWLARLDEKLEEYLAHAAATD